MKSQIDYQLDRRDYAIIVLAGLLSMLPYVIYYELFQKLFWFGDEWDQINQIDKIGFLNWVISVFAENFVPFFKLIWGGVLFLFKGSYAAMIDGLWINHALNVILLGILLRKMMVDKLLVVFAQLLFGLPYINLETLGWSIQWSHVMATTFLLGAFIFLLKLKASEFKCKRFWTLYVLCIGLGPLCFSRGIVTGLVVSLAVFFPLFKISKVNRTLVIVLSCLPCLIVGGVIFKFSSGNHHHFIDKLPEIIAFSSNFFALNPFLRLFDFWSHNLTFIFLGFLVKVFLYWFAFAKGTENQKLIVLLIVLFDVFNALIVGLGRFHTGLEASVSSRYQYQPMLSVAISLAILLQNMLFEFYSSRWQLQAVGFVLTIFLGLFLLMEWKSDLRGFTRTRGEDNRYIILHDNSPPQFGVAGIPFLKTKTARKLVKKYGLH